jgi:hypothetical protein
MEHYVTLFDSGFLPQGVALHRSLQRHAGEHCLWVLCMDEAAHAVLSRLQLPNVRLLSLAEVETDALRAVKPGRSRAEYCWTLTPFTPSFVFDADPSVRRVTYVDADIWLRAGPAPLFAEFERSGKQVQITDHAYAPEYDQSHKTGRYCVQFMTFTREGEKVRRWWAERCLEWCFARSEPGRFGDQKYLDTWPVDFAEQVHVAGAVDALQAPWNAKRFAPSAAITFHFHGLRLMKQGRVMITDHYDIPYSTFEVIYRPYLDDLRQALELLRGAGHEARAQIAHGPWRLRARALALRWRAKWREWTRPDIARIA